MKRCSGVVVEKVGGQFFNRCCKISNIILTDSYKFPLDIRDAQNSNLPSPKFALAKIFRWEEGFPTVKNLGWAISPCPAYDAAEKVICKLFTFYLILGTVNKQIIIVCNWLQLNVVLSDSKLFLLDLQVHIEYAKSLYTNSDWRRGHYWQFLTWSS